MTNETKVDQLLGVTGVTFPVTYPPPAYPVGVIDGQPYQLTVNGGWHPYIELEPVFFRGNEN